MKNSEEKCIIGFYVYFEIFEFYLFILNWLGVYFCIGTCKNKKFYKKEKSTINRSCEDLISFTTHKVCYRQNYYTTLHDLLESSLPIFASYTKIFLNEIDFNLLWDYIYDIRTTDLR